MSTASQLKSQAASANASIQNATTSLANANTAYQNVLSTAISNFTKCLQQKKIFLVFPNVPACTADFAGTATNSISSAFYAALQPFTQILGLSVNSVTATVIPLVTSNFQQLQQTFQASASQANDIVQQAQKCMSQAVSSAAAGANATTTTVATTSG